MTKNTGKMLWGGGFSEAPEKLLLGYMSGENVLLDERLIPYDILGNRAHVLMLAEQGILKREEARAILSALAKIESEWKAGKFELAAELEDVHMNVEAAVTKITPAGKKMHTARSRNDQVNLDVRMYMRDEALALAEKLIALQKAFAALAKKSAGKVMVGYTHTRVAQPLPLGMWCGAYFDGFGRDGGDLLAFAKAANTSPLGACALAGTSWNIDRKRTAELLGFEAVQENPFDVVSSRGEYELKLIGICLASMLRASRLAEELIFLSEKGLVGLPDRYTTGSSIMPQKKNPDALELVRGRAARVLGCHVHCAGLLKGLMSGHNADTQETKYALFMAVDTTGQSFAILSEIVASLSFDQEKILAELESGYACATALADLLARKGVPFREAHAITGKLVKECARNEIALGDLKRADVEGLAKVKLGEAEFASAVSPLKCAPRFSGIDLKGMGKNEREADVMKETLAKAFAKLGRLSV